ncbi:hypothetical protein B7486_08555 [cyanobacterium TDX16]|nr:hypothetical protein B7486_08555 [cyanobacterium TDX16]
MRHALYPVLLQFSYRYWTLSYRGFGGRYEIFWKRRSVDPARLSDSSGRVIFKFDPGSSMALFRINTSDRHQRLIHMSTCQEFEILTR